MLVIENKTWKKLLIEAKCIDMTKRIKKGFLIVGLSIVGFVLIVALAGMYKFNYLQDDIYFETEHGEVVKAKSDEAFDQGQNKLALPDYPGALIFFNQAVLIDSSYLEARYWKLFCEFNCGRYEEVLSHGTRLVRVMGTKKIWDDFVVNSETLMGLSSLMMTDGVEGELYFNAALLRIEAMLKQERNINHIMNKATLLCYLDKKEMALEYIQGIDFSNEELAMFGEQNPISIIRRIDKKVLLAHLRSAGFH